VTDVTRQLQRVMRPLELVKLGPLMDRTCGRPEIAIGLIDGPVAMDHPDLVQRRMQALPGKMGAACLGPSSMACMHGTSVAGILSARRGSCAPAICPGCSLLIRPIFAETGLANGHAPSATPKELAEAIVETIRAGARILNISAALVVPSSRNDRAIEHALDYAAQRSVIVVAAAGNQGLLGSSAITTTPGSSQSLVATSRAGRRENRTWGIPSEKEG
jgi:subtilisin family serine protease